jgi:signal transduction histidine kinase
MRTWFIVVILVALAATAAVAFWLASLLSRPITSLAAAAAQVDLNNPGHDFLGGERDDEVGVLARRLGSMVHRLRGSAVRTRDAERRATVGELARQVNHDIKNGLTPIRNVVRHLAQLAQDNPEKLPTAFLERKDTLVSSVEYLDSLSRSYARLSPKLNATSCDAKTVIGEVVASAAALGESVKPTMEVSGNLPRLKADAAVLRRMLENLVGNAVDAASETSGRVVVRAGPVNGSAGTGVRITVSDSGKGMTQNQLKLAFDDFYTTKEGGTGLGLSVVRRLVGDLGGVLRIETKPGVGTDVTLELPASLDSAGGAGGDGGTDRSGGAGGAGGTDGSGGAGAHAATNGAS